MLPLGFWPCVFGSLGSGARSIWRSMSSWVRKGESVRLLEVGAGRWNMFEMSTSSGSSWLGLLAVGCGGAWGLEAGRVWEVERDWEGDGRLRSVTKSIQISFAARQIGCICVCHCDRNERHAPASAAAGRPLIVVILFSRSDPPAWTLALRRSRRRRASRWALDSPVVAGSGAGDAGPDESAIFECFRPMLE